MGSTFRQFASGASWGSGARAHLNGADASAEMPSAPEDTERARMRRVLHAKPLEATRLALKAMVQ